jgi:hypothetical protein
MHEAPKAVAPFAATLALAVFASTDCALAEKICKHPESIAVCDQKSNAVCKCNLTKLRPLQGAVGEKEVEDKREKIGRDPKKAYNGLCTDSIKVVFGYGGDLYVVDHHHGAKAWLEANTTYGKTGFCQIVNGDHKLPYNYSSFDEFLGALYQKGLVHLKDQNGRDIKASDLPKTIDALPDDVYRSFAWKVRQAGGFCKSSDAQEFLEFTWADAAFRNNKDNNTFDGLTNEKIGKNVVKAGVDEAHKEQYKGLPGWTSSGQCNALAPEQ